MVPSAFENENAEDEAALADEADTVIGADEAADEEGTGSAPEGDSDAVQEDQE